MDHIRTWAADGFRLEVYDTYRRDGRGQTYLAYELYHHDGLVFEGDDFSPSPLHADDGDESVAGLLSFLSLKPGDTDPDYFAAYTAAQLDFARNHGEYLSLLADELTHAKD